MCPRDTFGRLSLRIFLIAGGLCAVAAHAETDAGWKRIAGTTFAEGLAGPAGGPVNRVWYASGSLLVQTASGRVFETSDFLNWKLNTANEAPQGLTQAIAADAVRQYALRADNLYGSGDAGRSWLNLTGFSGNSILGGGFNAVAVAPSNTLDVSVANRFGVWRSLDGGLSWRGLNEDLPNLAVRKLLDRRVIQLADGSLLDLTAGAWTPLNAAIGDPEIVLRARFSQAAHAEVSAAVQASSIAYAGTADGRLLFSRDNGSTWIPSPSISGTGQADRIARIWVDNDRPDVALAASGTRLFRTVNGGQFWDDVSGGLPDTQIHGIAADRSAGAVYLATDRGVLTGAISLNDAGPVTPNWQSISRDLPASAAWDVRLNIDNTLTVALDGYGVFEEPAPHQTRRVRVVNGADMSDRAAAPGSLISILGADVRSVTSAGAPYPVIASSPQSSQLQVPFEAGPGTIMLALQGASGRWTVPLIVKDAAPAIFVDSEGAPLILDASSGLVVDPKMPIYAGSTVQIMATGLGRVAPDWPTGVPAPVENPPAAVTPISAFLDGTPLEVTRATLAPGYVGYYIVELRIPSIVNRGASELRVVMNGEESNRIRLYLESDLPKF